MKNKIEIMFKTNGVSEINKTWIPAKVLREFERYYLVEILPHINPYHHFGISKPYKICLDKLAIMFNEIEVR